MKLRSCQQAVAIGYKNFLDTYPAAAARVAAITNDFAKALGVELDECRRLETAQELEAAAAHEGIDKFEYLLEFAVRSDDERDRLLQARAGDVKKALGL
jgi:hypothetical protein